MIIRRLPDVLQCITQPDHAALAGRIMRRWPALYDAERRASILLAVEEHDNGWRELDEAPLVDSTDGRPFDFVEVPAEHRQAVWPRGVRHLWHDPWAAALVAQHAIAVYERYRTDPAWTAFFPEMTQIRDTLLAQTPRSLADLEHDYAFIRIGDLLSLIFCNLWDGEQTYGGWSFIRDGSRVVVSPPAAHSHPIPIAVTAREVPNRPYVSDADFRTELRAATVVTLSGVVSGA